MRRSRIALVIIMGGAVALAACQAASGRLEAEKANCPSAGSLSIKGEEREWNNVKAQASFVSAEDLAQILAQYPAAGSPAQESPSAQSLEAAQASPSIQAVQSAKTGQLTETGGRSGRLQGKRIVAGVLPHHLVAGTMIMELLEHVAAQEPEVLVLIGPNHYNQGGRIITGLADWQTPLGLVKTEKSLVCSLLEQREVVRDEKILGKEHSVGNLMPLIKHFLPATPVVPVILHYGVSLTEVDQLLDRLQAALQDKRAVLLASVDFSHYLTREEAQEKDRFTLQVMRDFDYATLFRLDNAYLDSPASLAGALRWAERAGIKNFHILGNTNSGVLFRDDKMATTSYFNLLFFETYLGHK